MISAYGKLKIEKIRVNHIRLIFTTGLNNNLIYYGLIEIHKDKWLLTIRCLLSFLQTFFFLVRLGFKFEHINRLFVVTIIACRINWVLVVINFMNHLVALQSSLHASDIVTRRSVNCNKSTHTYI